MTKWERLESVKRYERMAYAGRAAATDCYSRLAGGGSLSVPISGFAARDMLDCSRDIEHTYLTRLFAEFEMTLRDFWGNQSRRRRAWAAKSLLDRVASYCSMPANPLDNAHVVREFRNYLVHGGPPVTPVPLSLARHYLCAFLSYLPARW